MRLVFVTDKSDAHVSRFDDLFRDTHANYLTLSVSRTPGGEPSIVVGKESIQGWGAIREFLAREPSLVVSAPLDTVTIPLAGGGYRHLGISFATDVMVTAAASSDALEALGNAVVMCDAIVTDNYATENALIALGVKDSAIIRVPWGPDTTHLSSLTRAEADWPDDRKILLYPRSVESHYQPDIFVTALAQIVHEVPDVLAVMVEAGSMVQEIKGLLSTAGLDDYVRWEPPSTPDYFQGLLGLADCVVVTPKTDGTSVTVMDAMNQGIPVVSSLTAGSAQWIIHGITGWSFPAGDAVKLAHVVVEVLTADTHRIEAITRNAKRLVGSRAGWQASSAQLRQVLASLLGRVSP
ncbi:MAG: hypothetical protein RL247_844 [Actinomycetota bacterium]